MRKSLVLAIGLFISITGIATSQADELAVDEPLNANARQNVRPIDDLLVDRNYELFADPRVRVVSTVGMILPDDVATNAKIRAAGRPTTMPSPEPTATQPSVK